MNVLSLFDGMSCGQLALNRAGIKYNKYFASEIDKYAIAVTQHNFPNTIQLGDVLQVQAKDLPKIDLIIGGSPCTGFSMAGKGLNFNDPQSKLFFEFVRLLKECQPKYFLLENVKMKKEYQDVISKYLGVEPIEINSARVSAQNRKRLYWANFPIEQPEDKEVLLKDVAFDDSQFADGVVCMHNLYGGFKEKEHRTFLEKSPTIRTAAGGGHIPSLLLSQKALEYMDREVKGGRNHWDFSHHSDIRDAKSAAVVANFFKGVPYNVLKDWNCIRKFHPIECERLQTVPDNYTLYGQYLPKIDQRLCAKQTTIAVIENQGRCWVGSNWCETPQTQCPRQDMPSGVGYELCKSVCQQPYHAEVDACRKAGKKAGGGTLYLIGHSYCCDTCKTVMTQYGIKSIVIGQYPKTKMSNSQRYKMLGNGWTVDVVAHIFKNIS